MSASEVFWSFDDGESNTVQGVSATIALDGSTPSFVFFDAAFPSICTAVVGALDSQTNTDNVTIRTWGKSTLGFFALGEGGAPGSTGLVDFIATGS